MCKNGTDPAAMVFEGRENICDRVFINAFPFLVHMSTPIHTRKARLTLQCMRYCEGSAAACNSRWYPTPIGTLKGMSGILPGLCAIRSASDDARRRLMAHAKWKSLPYACSWENKNFLFDVERPETRVEEESVLCHKPTNTSKRLGFPLNILRAHFVPTNIVSAVAREHFVESTFHLNRKIAFEAISHKKP